MAVIETKIPARLDRLPWARWHWMVLIGLGMGPTALSYILGVQTSVQWGQRGV